jgi:hypothetical protein
MGGVFLYEVLVKISVRRKLLKAILSHGSGVRPKNFRAKAVGNVHAIRHAHRKSDKALYRPPRR